MVILSKYKPDEASSILSAARHGKVDALQFLNAQSIPCVALLPPKEASSSPVGPVADEDEGSGNGANGPLSLVRFAEFVASESTKMTVDVYLKRMAVLFPLNRFAFSLAGAAPPLTHPFFIGTERYFTHSCIG